MRKQPRTADLSRFDRMISDEDVIDIFMMQAQQKLIAHRFGVSQSHVCKIKCGHLYGALTERLCNPKNINATLTTLAFTGGES